jgi:TRAP-type C4-dicarboxylate transport system permease small subunit
VTSPLSPEPAPDGTSRFDRIAARVENAALALAMALLAGIAGTQLILRSVFDTTLLWADELLRILVLWLAILGATAAARTDRHLRVDVFSRLLPVRGRELLSAAASLVALGVAGLFAYEAARFTHQAYTFQDTALGGVPQWPFLTILPLGLAVIAACYLRNAWRHLRRALAGEAQAR